MSSLPPDPQSSTAELVLKTMPPRATRHQIARPRLSLADERLANCAVVLVQAPPGFGKTSLLGQWRRECLARGEAVAWVTAGEGDDLQRLLHSLVQAVRVGCVRPAFGRVLLETLGTGPGRLEGMTALLAELAQTPLEIALVVDEAERLAPDALEALVYLLHNLTPNLHVVAGGRGGLDALVSDLVSFGEAWLVGPEELRFGLDETLQLARQRFGERFDADTVARLHEMSEGWPLGLQILMAGLERGGDPRARVSSIAGEGDAEGFVAGLFADLAPDDLDFLVRCSVVDMLHPHLCRTLTGRPDAEARLARLVRDTPVFVVGDDGVWVRLHNLVRDALRRRFDALPEDERHALHLRAMEWLAARGMVEEAAAQAHQAGRQDQAFDLAESSLYDAATQGRLETVLRWLDLLPAEELRRRPRLCLAAAWALAVSERHADAEAMVRDLLESQQGDALFRYECALIASGAAYYADDPDRFLELFRPWLAGPPSDPNPRRLQMHANRQAVLAMLTGDPAQGRRLLQAVPPGDFGKRYRYGARWGEFIAGLSYLWEGQVMLAEELLRPALAGADVELGRRHPLSCMIASVLAAALFERDRVDEAGELLVNRLDVLERAGTPDTVLLGYRSAARVAAARGIEHRALDLLEVMHAVGVSRNLPRLCVASLVEQVRMHAFRFRSETCRALMERIDELVARHGEAKGPIWLRSVTLLQRLAHGYARISAQDWEGAAAGLGEAQPLIEAARLGRLRIETMGLRALAMERAGLGGRPLLIEAMNLAQTFSLSRVFVDAHPALADWVRRLVDEDGGQRLEMAGTARPLPRRSTAAPRAVPSMVLTPKERTVLEYLARNLSNKEIAQTMEVGEETIKWHLKNLFGKLDAGTRKHAVRRAQLLGLLEGVD